MSYHLFRLRFPAGLSLGDGRLSDSSISLRADTVFSALCFEYMSLENTPDGLVDLVKKGGLKISDAYPFVDDVLYLPKPLVRVNSGEKEEGAKKAFKKLMYVPSDKMDDYVQGKFTKDDALRIGAEFRVGQGGVTTKASISRKGEETTPYHVGVFMFEKNAGLYFLAQTANDECFKLLKELLDRLSSTGIGGKKSSGYGRFDVSREPLPPHIRMDGEAKRYVSLSVGLPKDEEMGIAIEGASYALLKRSGFVASASYADNTYERKKDLFVFSSGSVFVNKFEGDVYDVSNGGSHPVYSYAKPLFAGICT